MHTTPYQHYAKFALLSFLVTMPMSLQVMADPVTPEVQAKVESFKKKLVEWAANPVLIAAVKESNARGGLVKGMNNAKWIDVPDNDPLIIGMQTSEAGKVLSQLSQDKGISKLYLRDEKANLIACDNKPLLYNNAVKPWIVPTLKDSQPWSGAEAKPDPATQIKGVHLTVPVLDSGKLIGLLHTSVIAE